MRYLTLLFLFVTNIALASVTDLKIGTAQIFDVQWYMSGTTLNVSSMTRPFISVPSGRQMTTTEVNTMIANNQYFGFFNSTTNSGTYGMAIYNSDGSLNRVIHNTGSFSKFGDGVIFYQGNNMWGTVISTAKGYSYGQSASFTQTYTPTATQISNYTPPSSTTLAAGETATVTPAYVSAITSTQQAHINSAQNLRDTITKNSIYIEQVGSSNQVTVDQQGRYNMVTGTGSTAAPVQGDYNTITIRQGDPVNTFGKNLVQLSVYGSSNTLNLNQGRDTQGGYTGADMGGHMQYVIVSGSSNSITTRQQNSGQGAHYLETNITGNNNTQNITQLGNAGKQLFTTASGDNNTFNAYQDGIGAHYLNVNFLGNGNDAQVTQTGNTKNAATINLTNSGAPASVTLQQSGGAIYNIDRSCTTTCGRVTVSQ